jgi:excinuclease ABC subunit C
MIEKSIVNNLASSPGVYLFKKDKTILYVGKSVNIRARVKSHIENAKLDHKEELIITESDSIETILTDSDFNAILLESELIQKYQPKYNLILKDDKSQLYIEVTKSEKYPKVILSRKPKYTSEVYFGPFSSVKAADMLVREIRKIIPYCTQPKVTKHPCFYSKIGLCDPCPNSIQYSVFSVQYKNELTKHYKKNIKIVINILKRKGEKILKEYYQKLKKLVETRKFEEAIEIRNKIQKLETLMFNQRFYDGYIGINYDNSVQSIELLCEVLRKVYPDITNLKRIECYDMSNLAQQQATASMVVFIDGRMDKTEYKRFKIKDLRLKTDTKYIEEIITRRFKNKWENPQLLVIDGGKPQVNTVLRVLRGMGNLRKKIPVIGIVKHPDRLIVGVDKLKTVYLTNDNPALNLVRAMRDEAHRFAKKYHILLREKKLLYN